jgi:DNA-binding GntR family transcriptional regulator
MPMREASAQATNYTSITARIRTAICEGTFVPNQRLIEADLCVQLGASRTAVRAALQDLTTEGLVERIQNRGARVRAVSTAEAVEITEVRMVIEGLCAAKAAQNISETEIEQLTTLRADLTAAVAARDILEYSRLNQMLHKCVREISGQRSACDILDRLRGKLVRPQSRLFMHPSRMTQSLPEHVAIIDEVCARNPELAEAAMRRHLESVACALREGATGEG